MTPPVALPPAGDPVSTAAFVARHGGRVVAYLDEVTTPERALRGAGEAFAALRVRLASPHQDDDAVGRALLSATRSAATRHAGRGLPAGDAPDAVAHFLVARHTGRLDPDDEARLDALLRDSPAARELAAGFDRAERGYARDHQAPLTGTEVGVIATAMALAAAPTAPAGPDAAVRRTAIPAPPTLPLLDADAETRRPADGAADGADPEPAPAANGAGPAAAGPVPPGPPGPPGPPEDPSGPESLGYLVPHPGLPRPERRPAPPRRRRRRTLARTDASHGRGPTATVSGAPGDAPVPAEGAPTPIGDAAALAVGAPPTPSAGAVPVVARPSQGVLQSAVVRQLGVPALLLLAVAIVALVAAGAFSGERDGGAPSVPRPTIPTVPDDPRAIPPLP
ncbi:hypothetical protein [Patulibacter americanus]|uniref:hypothetical protein n=1 Tax=Patulibacter americanus TaxID=588672 RepID=UPI0003B5D20A|nr:hypothetical protein [Patulibacter americanus]